MTKDTFEPMVYTLVTLAVSDKRFCLSIAKHDKFLVPEARLKATPPNEMMLRMMGLRAIEGAGIAGAAIEHQTILGRVLRFATDPLDPKLMAMFKNAHHESRVVMDGNISHLRTMNLTVQNYGHDLMMSLLKAGKESKEKTMRWVTETIAYNTEAEKGRPSLLIASSDGFRNNFAAIMLRICRPVISDIEKLKKVDWNYLQSEEALTIFKSDSTKLAPKSLCEDAMEESPGKEFNFITQSFFMTWRAIHLGPAQQCSGYINILRMLNHFRDGLESGEPRAFHALLQKICIDVNLLAQTMLSDLVQYSSMASEALLMMLDDGFQDSREWYQSEKNITRDSRRLLTIIPEHFLEDIFDVLLFVAKMESSAFLLHSLSPVLSLIVYFLRRPGAVTSPHLRAKFGQALYFIFLPVSARGPNAERWSGSRPVDGAFTELLFNTKSAQDYLAPALLLLYGDVERTGFYEKLQNRQAIMVVLKHLWTLSSHRPAFRGIAAVEGATADENYFVRFANGLLNETNSLVSSTIELLHAIKQTQRLMASTEWTAMTEERQNEAREEFSRQENECKVKVTDTCKRIHFYLL